ncbi:MAG: hypothetical protein A3D65_02880 [Candidatus Lloydbacteria bacterium RIFCSPHIGHO2_02_FULL_50_13]|uniref:HicB-like antitoxin of toxin-antitoxin system domain-containing protein n=1 Tax=Candidatus Lloydbacteria bacterium RIFCSPHIGHO2_02_FULL_50_13 TaxID=1798661 RepID=A0A1G2D531_9BACT|nr:MAG: hypothetical protein A3D65_02880 [Candidatus Lloydbacteria bacterium RIFCSPHIGHO2_02_FULL_50_13]
MQNYTYRVIIEPDEKETFHAYVPALPGCHTFGRSFAEARQNIRDAIDAYVRSMIADGLRVPEDRGIEVVETIFGTSAHRSRKMDIAYA